MQSDLFDYHLPSDRIAQTPCEPRDQAKLLILDRQTDTFLDRHIFDLPDLVRAGDLLIFNNSKVFKARLTGRVSSVQKKIELFLLHPEGSTWQALAKPGKKLKIGDRILFDAEASATLIQKNPDGTVVLDFAKEASAVFALAERLGEVPLPPYIKNQPVDLTEYQTIYAAHTGSVAAPTAGFHFTPKLFSRLEARGVQQAFVTLHVGLGTFRPMKTQTLEEHVMHREWFKIEEATVRAIEETKKRGGRIIAVGTTTVRALESAAHSGTLKPFSGFTDIFITPGFSFHVIDGLLTNFHLPKSTLLVLVSALAGRETIKHAYQHAIDHAYRFYSFGDAMLIL